jgi:coenzyme PQQ precursor peptide PqqA
VFIVARKRNQTRLRSVIAIAKQEKEIVMKWHAPKFIEVSCGMEINRYAPADGDEPILF